MSLKKRRIGEKQISSFLKPILGYFWSGIIVTSQTVFINAQSLKVFTVFHPSAHLRDIPEAFKHTYTQHWFIYWAFVLFDYSFIDWLLAEALLMALRLSWSGPKRAHSSAVRGHWGKSRLAQNADAPNSFELSEFWAGGIQKALLLYFAIQILRCIISVVEFSSGGPQPELLLPFHTVKVLPSVS